MFNYFSQGSQGPPSDSGSHSPPPSRSPSTASTAIVDVPDEQNDEGPWLLSPDDQAGPSFHSSIERTIRRGSSVPPNPNPNGSRHTRSHSFSPPTLLDGPPKLRLDTGDNVDDKGKKKRRQQVANPYMSPPLTNAPASESFLSGFDRVSRILSRGLDLDIVEDELEEEELQSERSSTSSGSSILTERELRRTSKGKEKQLSEKGKGKQRAIEPATPVPRIIEVEEDEEEEISSFDISSSSLTSHGVSTTTRQATVGDSTLDDPGSIVPSVRFPAIFNQGDDDEYDDLDEEDEVSTWESSPRSIVLPVLPPHILPIRTPVEEEITQRRMVRHVVEPSSPVEETTRAVAQRKPAYRRGRTHLRSHPAYVGIRNGRPRYLRRKRQEKSQERGLTRDFFLIITLCFGLACAGILILRPTAMMLLGYNTLANRLELDIY